MKHLFSLGKYFKKYKWRLLLGIFFISISNVFAVIPSVVVRNIIDEVQENISSYQLIGSSILSEEMQSLIFKTVLWNSLLLLGMALLRGLFMFLMRQSVIVMSRLIEYDQKNDIYAHYQQLDTQFFKAHFTGDLMNRIAEDVSRVRMFTGPAIMYSVNLVVLSIMCIWRMLAVDVWLTACVILPFPILAIAIFTVNKLIFKKSEKIQAQLSRLTTTAQESYSGIRVIKSFVQEKTMRRFFDATSEEYKDSAINLSLTEAIYFPAMTFFIGLSMLGTILVGGYLVIQGKITIGNITEFVFYINLLMFPISSIGWVASMIQRAAASQRRIDEFLDTKSNIVSPADAVKDKMVEGAVSFNHVRFVYPNTGIVALKDFNLDIQAGDKIAVIGKTGSGKSTLAHLLLRMYDPASGDVSIDGLDVRQYNLQELRNQIAYTPQEAFLFSDTIFNNIRFGRDAATEEEVRNAARLADLDKDVSSFAQGYETMIGERGVMLSGGQKQRIMLARAILKNSKLLILDECLSAVDTRTEQTILNNLREYLEGKTTIFITHRIVTSIRFDKILMLEDGLITAQGSHDDLLETSERYRKLYAHQTEVA